jgi:hypothetical protein
VTAPRALLLAVLLVSLVAACGGGRRATLTQKQLGSLVLQTKDLPTFSQFEDGPQGRADADIGARGDPARFGRLGGWIARYRRTSGGLATRGPLVVVSRADLFPAAAKAKDDLDAYATAYAQLGGRKLDAPTLGDGAVAYSFGSSADNFFLVAWRRDNATASVVVEGAHVRLADATALARQQDARIEAASKATADTRGG